ncbi:MAG: TetR family transcriptional regulator [Actinophytocola sp.]|uniref:TetR/AcrR family transcriptional regulator n=1 Tax=Actinophytocola sp. TaxID=1872138 RepID=UPI001320A88A|nr:TetR/AcrR family transcriptional regulator [Actinophytocola sp.]MPZ83504.1 TetR family transcriptional regulator [Actinophytocola sp.]
MTDGGRRGNARDRLLLAAGELLHESADGRVSTRAITERAGVQAPTLYHHFGSKQGLLDAVANYGFTQYLQEAATGPTGPTDPVASIRAGWDHHVHFGLEHPGFYILVYGRIEPGVPCTLSATAERRLLDLLSEVDTRLRVPAKEAAREMVAANVGITLSLIAQPEPDLAASDRLRDTVIDALIAPERAAGEVRSLATALLAAMNGDGPLTAAEASLLREWLTRLATQPR